MIKAAMSTNFFYRYGGSMYICKTITPHEYKKQTDGLKLFYGFQTTPFGECLIAITKLGICDFRFILHNSREISLDNLKQRWKGDYAERRAETKIVIEQLFDPSGKQRRLHLLLRGTDFQIQVWKALLLIPPSMVISYQGLAEFISRPKAVRATASAVANNPIGYIVPCHRVIRKNGEIGQYGSGIAMKKAILRWEATNLPFTILKTESALLSSSLPAFISSPYVPFSTMITKT